MSNHFSVCAININKRHKSFEGYKQNIHLEQMELLTCQHIFLIIRKMEETRNGDPYNFFIFRAFTESNNSFDDFQMLFIYEK